MVKTLEKIFALLVLFAIIPVSLSGVVNADRGMKTYINETYELSIDYPNDWEVVETLKSAVVGFGGEKVDGFITSVNIIALDKSPDKTVDDFAKSQGMVQLFFKKSKKWEEFNDSINNEPVAGYIYTYKEGGTKIKQKDVYFGRNKTGYLICFGVASSAYDEMHDNYFEPMLRSFKFVEKRSGIIIQNLTVAPSKVKTGESYTVKFEARNEEGIEKKEKIFYCVKDRKSGQISQSGFETCTFAPYETKIIEWTNYAHVSGGDYYTPVQEQIVSVEGQLNHSIEVTEAPKETLKVEASGFTAMPVIIGLLAVVYLLRRRK